jgi:hypothetical protein
MSAGKPILMNRISAAVFALIVGVAAPLAMPAAPAWAQAAAAADPQRDATRERLRALLAVEGRKIGVEFRQSDKEPYNFVGLLSQGLSNSDSMEIVVSVTKSATVGYRIYPHYKGGYINIGRVRDSAEFAHRLLRYNDDNFLFWGIDDTGDTFAAYTFTLESGFPDAAMDVVIRSISGQDRFVGELRPAIDGSAAQ